MGDVFANGREVSAKKDANKSICAMPDVCLSPPSPPAGPIPIPYPNTSDASKTSNGSKNVKIGGKEVGLKNKSIYKKSNGDEAATRSFGMGVVTHKIQGKTKFAAWSFDVKIEGSNAIRHMDITTHNHINNPNIALVISAAAQNVPMSGSPDCSELDSDNNDVRDEEDGDLVPRTHRDDVAFTSTTASYRPYRGRNSISMKAVSDQSLISAGKEDGFAPSRPADSKMACSNQSWGGNLNSNHTEPKLIEQIFDAAKKSKIAMPATAPALGTLKMNIHHKPAGESADKMPCGSCKKGVCKAQECGLEIILCNENDEEVSARDLCEGGEPKNKSEWSGMGL